MLDIKPFIHFYLSINPSATPLDMVQGMKWWHLYPDHAVDMKVFDTCPNTHTVRMNAIFESDSVFHFPNIFLKISGSHIKDAFNEFG